MTIRLIVTNSCRIMTSTEWFLFTHKLKRPSFNLDDSGLPFSYGPDGEMAEDSCI